MRLWGLDREVQGLVCTGISVPIPYKAFPAVYSPLSVCFYWRTRDDESGHWVQRIALR